jgi:hypothetical protein
LIDICLHFEEEDVLRELVFFMWMWSASWSLREASRGVG